VRIPWVILGALEVVLLLAIIAFAVEEAVVATTGVDRATAVGEVFFWLGFLFSGGGLATAGAAYRTGAGATRIWTFAIPAILFGVALIAFSLAIRG